MELDLTDSVLCLFYKEKAYFADGGFETRRKQEKSLINTSSLAMFKATLISAMLSEIAVQNQNTAGTVLELLYSSICGQFFV